MALSSPYTYANANTNPESPMLSKQVYADATTREASVFAPLPFNFGTIIDHVTALATVARAQLVSHPGVIIRAGEERSIYVTPLEGSNERFGYGSVSQYGDLQAFVIIADFFFTSGGEFKPPNKGDKIAFTVGGVRRTYEVNPPDDGPVWEWYGLGKRNLLVYAMRPKRGKFGEA